MDSLLTNSSKYYNNERFNKLEFIIRKMIYYIHLKEIFNNWAKINCIITLIKQN